MARRGIWKRRLPGGRGGLREGRVRVAWPGRWKTEKDDEGKRGRLGMKKGVERERKGR